MTIPYNGHDVNVDLNDAWNKFCQEMRSAGMEPPHSMKADSIVRCPALTGRGRKKKDKGSFLFHSDGWPAGWYDDHGATGVVTWKYEPDGYFPPRRRGDLEAIARESARLEEIKKIEKFSRGAERAERMWNESRPADTHGYLESKGVQSYGLRVNGKGELIIPATDLSGNWKSVQRIFWIARADYDEDMEDDAKPGETGKYDKRFSFEGTYVGGMFVIGDIDPSGVILIGEGYATMATLHDATKYASIVAFNADNLPTIAAAIRAEFPAAKIIITADNDHESVIRGKLTNIGIIKGKAAAEETGSLLAIPTVGEGDSDFNDMAKALGISPVREAIEAALSSKPKKAKSMPKKSATVTTIYGPAEPDADRKMFDKVEIDFWPAARKKEPYPNDLRNVKAVLDAAGISLKRDSFTETSIASFNGVDHIIDDAMTQRIWTMFQNSDLRTSLAFTSDAVMALSQVNKFDSAIDMFNSLPEWDGVVRAETLLIDELGASDTPYTRGATKLFFATLVRRGMGRESKCDEMVTLFGPQGIGKSTIFKFLIGEDLFQENLKLSHSTKEVLELTIGKLIAEMAELSGMKKSDRNDVKTFFSTTHDEARLSYGRHATRRQRRFAFVGTANPEGKIINMLEEDRRFIIVNVSKKANLDRVKADRLQILAEAMEIERNYGHILELEESLRPDAKNARAAVVSQDEYEVAIRESLGGIVSGMITSSDVYAFLGLRDKTAIGKYTKSNGGINPMMEAFGWEYKQVRKPKGGVRAWVFVKGSSHGWLRAEWPHGTNAPAEIVVDEDLSPGWYPKYEDEIKSN
jgi:phage/plasmid primase-like uncharacterized protein